MGFVVEGRDWSDGDEEGQPSFSAFVFESNTEGEKVGAPNTHIFFFPTRRDMSIDAAQMDIEVYLFVFIHRYVTP